VHDGAPQLSIFIISRKFIQPRPCIIARKALIQEIGGARAILNKDLEANKWVKIEDWEDRVAAHQEILSSIERYNNAPVKPCF
jgi:hypothetical protein